MSECGWDDVSLEIETKQISSEELSDLADALRSDSECGGCESGMLDSGLGSDSEDDSSHPWWASYLFQHTKGISKPATPLPISLLSGCSGACSEGAALKARLVSGGIWDKGHKQCSSQESGNN